MYILMAGPQGKQWVLFPLFLMAPVINRFVIPPTGVTRKHNKLCSHGEEKNCVLDTSRHKFVMVSQCTTWSQVRWKCTLFCFPRGGGGYTVSFIHPKGVTAVDCFDTQHDMFLPNLKSWVGRYNFFFFSAEPERNTFKYSILTSTSSKLYKYCIWF